MSGTKYVTISLILPGITRLLEILHLFESKYENKKIENLAIKLHDDLFDRTREYFNNSIVIAATYLDKRYRNFQFIKDQKERDIFINKAITYIKTTSSVICKSKSTEKVNDEEQPKAKKKCLQKQSAKNFNLLCDEEENDERFEELNQKEELVNELKTFSALKVKLHANSNPLDFFKDKRQTFPHLCQVAKIVFSATASSVPSESLFSSAKDVITDKRNRLMPKLAEELLIISLNKHLA
jgi:hypothetical protein